MPPASDTRTRPPRAGVKALVVLVLVVALGSTAMFLLAGALVDDTEPAPRTGSATGVTDEDYAAVDVGARKEAVEQLLLPATAVDTAVLEEYALREPATPAASCVYYESQGGTADDLYRFCFAEDRLVDKTVVLPPEDGVTGS
jgi:hypothetical protein